MPSPICKHLAQFVRMYADSGVTLQAEDGSYVDAWCVEHRQNLTIIGKDGLTTARVLAMMTNVETDEPSDPDAECRREV